MTANLDFENYGSYTLTVTVTDDGPGNLRGTGLVTITLLDVNEVLTSLL